MNVRLGPEAARFVEDMVRSGVFTNAEEVVNDAVEMLREMSNWPTGDLKELRAAIALGIAQLEQGRGRPLSVERVKAAAARRTQQ